MAWFRNAITQKSYWRLLQWVKPYKWQVLVALISSAIYGGFSAAPAKLSKPLMDDIFQSHDQAMLKLLPLMITGVFLGKGIFNYVQTYYMRWVGQRVILDMRNNLFDHILKLHLGFFQKNPSGTLMSRISNDVSQIQLAVSQVIADALKDIFSIIFLLSNIVMISWRLAIFAVFILPASMYPIIRFAKSLRTSSRISQEKMADLNSTMHETFYGINIVKAFNMEEQESGKFHHFNLAFFDAMIKAMRLDAISPSLMEFIGALGAAALIWIGGSYIVGGKITPGIFTEFIASLFLLYSPIKNLSKANYNVQRAIAAAERIFEVLDEPITICDAPDAVALTHFSDAIKFERVSFKYEEKFVLENIDFTASRGQIVAIVGSSGAGKTTMMTLLPRFFEVTEGRITIDDRDIRGYTMQSLRDHLGMVTQETILFHDTIASNLTSGRNHYSTEEIVRAATAAYAHDFISELPNGYETVLGERGVTLSGGQRQRLTIARAILKNPPILILDEATSSLDSESEAIIQAALNNLMKNRTTFVIAHRLSTVRIADFILVIKEGHIVERGTHDELMTLSGEYRRLYDMQFKNGSSGVQATIDLLEPDK